jgi:hypothetical protein
MKNRHKKTGGLRTSAASHSYGIPPTKWSRPSRQPQANLTETRRGCRVFVKPPCPVGHIFLISTLKTKPYKQDDPGTSFAKYFSKP